MFKFDKLVFGDAGWGDEFLIATLMTVLVSILSMGLGLFLAIITVWAKIIQNKITRFINIDLAFLTNFRDHSSFWFTT